MSRAPMVVIGDATLDVHAIPSARPAPGSDVPAEVALRAGGQGANLAVRLARQDVPVTLVCALGDDLAADMIRAGLVAEGVTLAEQPSDRTGVVVVIGSEGGERSMLSDRARLPAALAAPTFDPGAWLLVSGYLLLQPGALQMATRLAELPMRRVLVGCSVTDGALDDWRAAARALQPDLVIANREEVDRARLEPVAGALAITDATGAGVRIGGVSAVAAAPAGDAAVDTTGAGDAFAAVLTAALSAADWPPDPPALRAAVSAAVELASAVARVRGAQAGVPGERAARLPA